MTTVPVFDLHTVPTANGYKASIMLEELGLSYQVKTYDLIKGEQLSREFLALNPVGRLPTLVDHDSGEADRPITVYGSAAILIYLAEKFGQFLPTSRRERARVFEWIGIISGDLGPAYSGQFVFNVVAPEKQAWAIEFYNKLCLRLVTPLEQQLALTPYLAGDEYSIADIIAYPVAAVSMLRYPGNLDAHPHLSRWAKEIALRPAVERGMRVPS